MSVWAATALVGALTPPVVAAQLPEIRGYYLNVGVAIDSNAATPRMLADAQRLRLMTTPRLGPFRFDVAYEHLIQLSSELQSSAAFGSLVPTLGGGEWLPLQGTITDRDRFSWRHQVDRASVSVGTDWGELIVGRQPISWATTLFLSPMDPFVPFDPSDPFREFRKGVDAVRARIFPGPMSEVDGVVRIAKYGTTKTVTAAARGKAAVGRWELTGWAGAVQDEPAAAAGFTVTVAGAVVRAEGGVQRGGGRTVGRVAAGIDRSFAVAGRTLYVVLEYQHDGFGAARSTQLPSVFLSTPAARGELQVFGRDEAALSASYQVHPLVSLDLVGITNLDDPSALLSPAVSYSAGDEVSLRGGVYVGIGKGVTAIGLPASEYGAVPTAAYVSLTWFF